MKKLIGIFLFLWAAGMMQAQSTDFQPEWSFGGNAGVTLSKIRFNPKVPQDIFLQSTGGLTVRYISEKHFGLQVELNYAQRGWKEMVDTIVNWNEYSRRINYLELPLMTHLYFNMGSRARLVFNFGPQIGLQIGEKVLKREIKHPDKVYPAYYDLEKVQRKFDYGIAGGGGIEIRTGIGSFVLEGRYYFGLSDIFDNNTAVLDSEGKRKNYFQASANQVASVKLTYFYRIGK